MSQLRDERTGPGLRERKKARTRAAIQHHALRLFRERGYDATTVEQVAAAAEVAPSTVFRYFPTKEDLVTSDDYDPMLAAALRAQPPELSPIRALRAAMREVLDGLPPEELAEQRDRVTLTMSEPALRGTTIANIAETIRVLSEAIGERTGRAPDEPAVRVFTGAVVGAMFDVMLRWSDDADLSMPEALDDAFARLEHGLPL